MKVAEFVKKLKDIANNHKTLYILGCFGAPIKSSNVNRYCTNYAYNAQADRTKMIKAVADKNPPVFGFDCVCLIKGVLWGWDGSANKTYGGAYYQSNGVPDIDANGMFRKCTNQSTDFSKIEVGEAVWIDGHIGVYVGDGLVVECTPSWKNCVQFTALKNIGTKSGYNARTWTKHGKLPYVEYEKATTTKQETTTTTKAPATSKETTTAKVQEYKVGDIVHFTGCIHYSNSLKSGVGYSCKAGLAKVTGVYKGKPHPYHLINVSGKGSTVYGFVNASDIACKATSTKVKTHKAVKGDTLEKIAKANNTTVDILVKLNGIKNKNILYVGQIIKLP